MIAACPKCSTRYRVDPQKLGPEGARLRCTSCESVFRVQPPTAAAEAPKAVAVPVTAPPAASAASPAGPAPETPVDSARAVLVADSDVENGKRTAAAIAGWGLHPLLVHDGVEAILAIQRNLPAVAVIDAALPKMFGFQVCEMVKRNESLKYINIVLVGAIHHADRYRRPPSDLYGADSYIEQPDLPSGLRPLLERLGLVTGAAPSPQAPAPEPIAAPPAPAPQPIAVAPPAPEPVAATPVQPTPAPVQPTPAPVAAAAPPAADDPQAAERAKAERLARIIVSDIVLYHPDKFTAAVSAGNVAEALKGDLVEGRALFNQRIDAAMREERDFLMDELNRVAAQRSQ